VTVPMPIPDPAPAAAPRIIPGQSATFPSMRRILLLCLGLVILGAFLAVVHPEGRSALASGVAWLRDSGATGRAVAVALVVCGIPLGVPTVWFAALIGYLYGIGWGLALALPAVLAGALAAFGLSRWLLHAEVARLVATRRRWRAVHQAVADGGVRLVVLFRIAGPHNMLNLVFAATPLSVGAFAIGTAVGSLPSVALATLGGALAPDAAALWRAGQELGPAALILGIAGGAALLVAALLTWRATQTALARAEAHAAID
jgi:uncharacterized membrane protein YdjX (TVP38/TMEM64 family)